MSDEQKQMADDLHALQYIACINQRYHQVLTSRWFVLWASLTVAFIWMPLPYLQHDFSRDYHWWLYADAGLFPLFLLAQWRLSKYRDLFVRWSGLRQLCEQPDASLAVCQKVRHEIERDEPAPWRGLLLRVQHDENQSRYGLRTYAEIVAAKQTAA